MRIDINRVPEGHSALSLDVQVTGDSAQGLAVKGIVSTTAELDRLKHQIHARIGYRCMVELQCSRCLSPTVQEVRGEFRLVVQERSKSSEHENLPEEDVDVLFDAATGEIDLMPFIVDEILISVPMKPLCSEECRGIALVGDPAVSVEFADSGRPVDPRWATLEKLKTKNA